jgi:hypothetical protein
MWGADLKPAGRDKAEGMAEPILLTRGIGVERMRKSSQRRRETAVTSVDLEQRAATPEAEMAKLKAEIGTASGKQYPNCGNLRRRRGLRRSHETVT